jgi:hypothetical protein
MASSPSMSRFGGDVIDYTLGTSESHDSDLTLDDTAAVVYRCFVAGPASVRDCAATTGLDVATVGEQVIALERWNLLRRSTDGEAVRWEAVPPEIAAASMLRPMRTLRDRVTDATDGLTRTLGMLVANYRAAARDVPVTDLLPAGRETFADADSARQRLTELAAATEFLVLSMSTSADALDVLTDDPELDEALIRRGVDYRVLWPHAIRRRPRAADQLARLAEGGAQVRTAAAVPYRAVVLDRSSVFLATGPGGVLVRDPLVIELVERTFWHGWETALPVRDGTAEDELIEDIERTILAGLAEGRTDEAIARKLSISTRTLRRYLSLLSERLGVETRFQLGVRSAALSRLLDSQVDA